MHLCVCVCVSVSVCLSVCAVPWRALTVSSTTTTPPNNDARQVFVHEQHHVEISGAPQLSPIPLTNLSRASASGGDEPGAGGRRREGDVAEGVEDEAARYGYVTILTNDAFCKGISRREMG